MNKQEHQELTLEEKRKQEYRSCPQCLLEIFNPFIERCPRCFASLPTLDLNCNGCLHRFSCPVAKD